MRVVEVTRFGAPEVLQPTDAPEPEPGPGTLLVDVEAAEVLFLDTQLRAGWGREYFSIEPPFVPGEGIGGVVRRVGEGVDPRRLGQRVVAEMSRAGEYTGGGYAERAVVAAESAHEVSDGVDLRAALAALHDGMLAVGRVELAQIERGNVVLVTAAGGSVGAWLVPLAASAGATVIAAARGEAKLALARARGATLAVDYSDEGWTERLATALGGRRLDVIFDGAGGSIGDAAVELAAPGARFFAYGAASGRFADKAGAAAGHGQIHLIGLNQAVSPKERRRHVAAALELLATGAIDPVIGQQVPLERAAEAHAAIERRSVVGKSLLIADARAAA